MSEIFRARLNSINNPRDLVVFKVSPEINESRSVNYKSQEVLHMPGSILSYASSGTRTFNVVVKLIARNIEEATENAKDLQLMKSWSLPYFGNSGAATSDNSTDFELYKSLLGQPPEVLHFNAYSDPTNSSGINLGNINNVPVVVTQIGNSYPTDVTYFPTINGDPFPVLMTVDILLTETHAPSEYTNFSLSDYKNGILENF